MVWNWSILMESGGGGGSMGEEQRGQHLNCKCTKYPRKIKFRERGGRREDKGKGRGRGRKNGFYVDMTQLKAT